MAFRRLSAIWVACLGLAFVACNETSKPAPQPTSTPGLTLSIPTGVKRILAKGESVQVNVLSTLNTGNVVGPLPGRVVFTVDPALGNVTPDPLDLTTDSKNETRGVVTFTMCREGATCKGGTKVPIKAELKSATDESLAPPTSLMLTIESDPDESCDKNDPLVCADSKCANATCTAITGQGKCDGATQACVVPVPNDGEVQLEVKFEYVEGSANVGKTPPITALPKGSDAILVKTRLTKIDPTSKVDVSKLRVNLKLAASGSSVVPGSLLNPTSMTESTDVTVGLTDFTSSVRLTPSTGTASGTLTISVLNEDNTIRARLTDVRPVNVVVPGSLSFAPAGTDAYNRTLGIKGSGFQEQSVLRFALLDSSGRPWSPSLGEVTVNFEVIGSAGGLSVSPLVAKLDPRGEVTTTIYSGTSRGSTTVRARTTIGGTTLEASSEPIVVVGAKPTSRNFALSCEKAAINALSNNNCSVMTADLTLACSANLLDRYNNPVGRRTRVSWSAEAGSIGLPTSTVEADPDNPSGELGVTTNLLRTKNALVPFDTTPIAGEPQRQRAPGDPCHAGNALTYFNPRDGLVTIVAYTQGEESFDDLNGNSTRDPNEPFDDLGEPFVDRDDSGTWELGEEYFDVNGNNQWDGPNGKWESDTVIWTRGYVVFTGAPTGTVTADTDLSKLEPDQIATLSVRWEDENLNEPASASTTYTAKLLSGTGTVAQVSPDVYPNRAGSMRIKSVRALNSTTNTYEYRSNITFDSAPQQTVKYTPPVATGNPGEGETPSTVTTTSFEATVGLTATLSDVSSAVSVTRDISGQEPVCTNSSGDPVTNSDADCTKAACNGQACTLTLQGGGTATGSCKSRVCDPSTAGSKEYLVDLSFVNSVTSDAVPQRLTANSTPVRVTATATRRVDGQPAPGVNVTFDLSNSIGTLRSVVDGSNLGTNVQLSTGADGKAIVLFVPGAIPAKGNFSISFDNTTVRRIFDIVVPGTLQFAPSATDGFFRVMGIKTSGWREQNVLRFKLLDSTGQPYLGDAEIHFSVSPLGGVRLVPDRLKTDSSGEVVTQLYSGVQAGTVSVTATTTINGQTLTVQSETIAVVGAKANGRNIAMRCDKLALPALLSNNCSFTFSDFTTACTAVIGDRFNNTLGRSTRVTWLSEAGLFGPPSSTPIANPEAEPAAQPELGRTINTLRTLNTPLPMDVDPNDTLLPGESTRVTAVGGACPRTGNLRDGLVTLIAATEGEEGFIDANNNGAWDPGEKFFDLGEPYVDSNDDGTWNAGELYIDVDGNGTYTPANNRWDENTTIWTTSHVAYTGLVTQLTFDFPSNPMARTQPPFADYDTSFTYTVKMRDENGNEPAPTFSTYGLSAAPGNGTARILSGANPLDQLGSMIIKRPTVCGYNSSAPDACKLTTSMSVSDRVLFGQYSAPTVFETIPRPLGDEIIASVTQPDGSLGTITMSGSVTVPAAAIPRVGSLQPSGGPGGTLVTVVGANLNGRGTTLYFQDATGVTLPMTLASTALPNQLTFRIPMNAVNGASKVWVQNVSGGDISEALTFVVGAVPTITSFTPTTGVPGQARVTAFGTGFTVSGLKILIGNTQIEPPLSGPSNVFYRVADQIRFVVPAGVRSGPITITTDAGSVTTATNFVVPAPTFVSPEFSPSSASVGDSVTLHGTGFNVGGLLIDVNGVLADPTTYVIGADSTSETVQFVVPAGATSGPISLTTNGGAGPISSSANLIITP